MNHKMKMVNSQDGVEEWYCPKCGHRLTIQYHPYSHHVLVPGDQTVTHHGSSSMPDLEPEVKAEINNTDPYLEPFDGFLKGKI
jgi:hypothetical protein